MKFNFQILTLIIFIILTIVFVTLYVVEINSKCSQKQELKSNNKIATDELKTNYDITQSADFVTVTLQGGLGNQMFQIASAYAYSQDYTKTLVLNVSKRWLPADVPRKTYFDQVFPFVQHVNQEKMDDVHWSLINERRFNFDKLEQINGDVKLIGYFQSEQYFYKYRTEIIKLFIHPLSFQLPSYFTPNSVSLHIRRTDYLTTDLHTSLSLGYYNRGVNKIKEHLDVSSLNIVVFSDDLVWCREKLPEYFKNDNLTYCDVGTDYEQLLLISKCTHHISANSSFSWWGAYLSEHTNGLTIVPSQWFSTNDILDWSDIYVSKWMKLDSIKST